MNLKYKFDYSFQEHILASFISDEEFTKNNLEIINPEFFDDEILRGIAETFLEFYKKEKESPSKEVLLNEIHSQIAPGRKINEYNEAIESIYEKFGNNVKYYQDKAIQFAKAQSMSNAIKESSILLNEGDFDGIKQCVDKAIKVGDSFSKSKIYNFFDSLRERAIMYKKWDKRHSKDRLSTGYSMLDNLIQGGLGRGETGILIAPPKHGKTTLLINFATNALVQGKKVLYITLELSKEVISSKFDTNLFGHNLEHIKKKPKTFYQTLKKLREKITGNLHIIQFPTKGLTLSKLESLVHQLNPEIVFVDYLAIMRSVSKHEDRRLEISDLHEGTRYVAGECNVPIWSAHQSNRPGLESKIIGMEHIAEDFNVGAICDIAISINQNVQERSTKKLRLYIMGSRLGPSDVQVEFNVDWGLARVRPAFIEDKELEE